MYFLLCDLRSLGDRRAWTWSARILTFLIYVIFSWPSMAQPETADSPMASLLAAKCQAMKAAKNLEQEMHDIGQQKEKVGEQMMREGTNDTLEFEYRKLAASEASLDQTLTKYRTFARNADKLLPAGSAPCP